jgi:hypothetical protein
MTSNENEHVIVGPPRAMILFKPPAAVREGERQLITTVDIIGKYRDGYFLATCSQKKLVSLRAAGAEVLVLDPDANHFAAQTEVLDDDAQIAMIETRIAEARAELAVANASSTNPNRNGDSNEEEPA